MNSLVYIITIQYTSIVYTLGKREKKYFFKFWGVIN